MPLEQRTSEGAILRQALDQIQLTGNQRGRIVSVFDRSGVNLGMAMKTSRGWQIHSGLRAAVQQGKATDITVEIGVSW